MDELEKCKTNAEVKEVGIGMVNSAMPRIALK